MHKPIISRAGRTVLPLTLVVLLAACGLNPTYDKPDLPLPDAPAGEVVEVAPKWWEAFQDPVLNNLVDKALERSPSVELAMARVDEARAVLGITSSEQLPQVNGSAGASRGQRSESVYGAPQSIANSYSVGLSASWELDLWGRVRNSTAAARANLLASEYALDGARLTLAASVAEQYFALQSSLAGLETSRKTVETRKASYELRKKQFEGGITSELDMRQAETEVATARSQELDFATRVNQQESALSVLVGQSPRELFAEGITPTKQESSKLVAAGTVPSGLPSDLLLRRPDIQQAEQNLRASQAKVSAARAAYFPRISLTGFLGLESGQMSTLFDSASGAWSFAGNLAMPIFNSGLTAAQVDQARAQEKAAVATYRQAVSQAFADTRAALRNYQAAEQKHAVLAAEQDVLKRQLYLANLRYNNGYSSYLEVLDSERSLFQGELSLEDALRQKRVALVTLYKVLGGGWQVPGQDGKS
ncbi:efflux transporter outer membrane subunit [Chitinilyticum piscinae]|uniref:Efflux transporter outer membrane subunit n=1 Tax=Chitinilyticum piscinae TaxID=2866724 RepID=A0A8J7FGV0_9NEIS|nr:efflux transporter outer membrane subunit [Chitinilyticum piscinae]MBE9609168.1 efflux transporter outer membrane subunit [Chitinilyticum piscinae]